MKFCKWLENMKETYNISNADIIASTKIPRRTFRDNIRGNSFPKIETYKKYIDSLYFRYCQKKPTNENAYNIFLNRSYLYFEKQEKE